MNYTRRDFIQKATLTTLGFSGLSCLGAVVPKITDAKDKDKPNAEEGVLLFRRSVWTNQSPRLKLLHSAKNYDKITLHHTGAGAIYHTNQNAVICDIDGVFASHMNRNYGDIGYHFILDYAGRVWEGRSLLYQGAHVCHHNKGNIGIMLLGNFEKQQPSALQLEAMQKLVGSLKKKYSVKPKNIFGHRDIGQSLCPGKNLYPHVHALRA